MFELATMHTTTIAAAADYMLVDLIKPLLLLPAFVAYFRVTSAHIEKDARYHNFGVSKVNLTMMIGAVVAIIAALIIPIFWIGWPVSMLVLGGWLFGYMKWRNGKVSADQKFELVGDKLEQRRDARLAKRAQNAVELKFIDPQGQEKTVPLVEDPLHLVHKELETILGPAIAANASELNLVPSKQGTAVISMLDTVADRQEILAPETASALIDYLKMLAALDTDDRRRIQEASLRMVTPSGSILVDLTVSGSSNGQRARICFDRAKRLAVKFDDLGLLPKQAELLKALENEDERHGVILVVAPPGQGLSTTSYAMLGQHDAFTSVVKSCEKRIDLEVMGVDQKRWHPTTDDVDYTTSVRTILRRDPDVVLVDNIEDPGTAELLAKSGKDGPLIIATVRARSVKEAIQEWSRAVGDLEKACSNLKMIVASRILRRLCPVCKQAYQPTPDQLKQMGLPADSEVQLYRPTGKVNVKNKIETCDTCNGIGYTGTIAAFEVFPVDNTTRKLLAANDMKGAANHVRREYRLPTMQEVALSKVKSGDTSIDEVLRVLVSKKASTTQKKPATAKASN
jgi:type II secretory ATPase GspE/PulE/Tfp pilus assembly ATPase PilB-like protein